VGGVEKLSAKEEEREFSVESWIEQNEEWPPRRLDYYSYYLK